MRQVVFVFGGGVGSGGFEGRGLTANKNRGGGTYGVVMMISASTSSLSKVEFSPSLSEVVTRV